MPRFRAPVLASLFALAACGPAAPFDDVPLVLAAADLHLLIQQGQVPSHFESAAPEAVTAEAAPLAGRDPAPEDRGRVGRSA